MRIHFGFSKRISIKTILTLISALFIGLCAFLGITEHEIVFADTIDIVPTQNYYYNPLQADKITKPVDYQSWIFNNAGGYRLVNTSQGANSENFTFEFTGTNLCSSSNGLVASAKLRFLLYDSDNQQLNSFNIQAKQLSNNATIFGQLDNPSAGYYYIQYNNFYPNRGFKIIFNSSDPSTIGLYSVYIAKSWDITCGEAPSDSSQDIIDNQTQNTADIINNQNQNTQDIINNNNQNTQDIIDNQNANNEALIDSQKVCKTFLVDVSNVVINGYLNSDGSINTSTSSGITDYLVLSSDSSITVASSYSSNVAYSCFYDSNKNLKSCFINQVNTGNSITIPSGSSYVRFTINKVNNLPQFNLYSCIDGNQAIVDSNNQLNDSLNNSNVDSNTGNDFFDMNINEHGIANILTSPIRLLQALTSSNNSCNSLDFTINLSGTSKAVSIPSGCILWDLVPNSISALFVAIVYGLFAYYVLIDLYKFIHGLLDPDDKNMYVLDL